MKRPILYIVIPLCLGIALARFLNVPIVYPIALSFVFILISILKSNRNILSHLCLYLAVFFFGIAHYQNSINLPQDHISNYTSNIPQRVLIRGIISDDPARTMTFYKKEKTSFILKTEAVESPQGWMKTEGLIKTDVYSDKGKALIFGDELVLEGLILKPSASRNPGVFDYAEYLEIKDICAVLKVKEAFLINKISSDRAGLIKKFAYRLRNKIRKLFDTCLKNPYSGFMKAILIGDRTGLDENLKDDFVKTGTVHILPWQYTQITQL